MKKRIWIILVVLVLVAAAGGGGYWAWRRSASRTTARQSQTLSTGTVSRGDIVITADGTGNLLPSTERALAFRISGTLVDLKVKVGDKVKAGDVLARLDTQTFDSNVRTATAQLEQARLALQKAQRAVDSGTDLAIAAKSLEAARLGIVNATGNYSSTLLTSNVASEVDKAKFWNDFWQSELGTAWVRLNEKPNSEARLVQYEQAGARAAQANADMLRITQDAQNNLTAAQRSLVSAQQSYLSALANYDSVKNSDTVKSAELAVLQAEISLTKAQLDQKNATLVAPVDGTITAVSAQSGDSVGASSIMTLMDLDNPLVRFYVEEADLAKVAVGNKVNLTFEAWQDRAFTGKIIRVDPALVTEGNTQAVQVWAAVDRPAQPATFYSNMSVEVEVVSQETRNALLVPLTAVRDLTSSQSAVFVVKPNNKLELRLVKVGLKDYVNAEILSGVNLGETVSLGAQARSTQTTRSTQSTRSTQQQGGPPDGMPFPGGGMR